jgi:hypothetical protein
VIFGLPDEIYMAQEAVLFIDEGYLSFISKYFGGGRPLKNHIEKFSQKIAKEAGYDCREIYFYTAPPYQSSKPTPNENLRKANYDKFVQKLKLVCPKIYVREGRCQKD